MSRYVFIFLLLNLTNTINCFINVYPKLKELNVTGDAGNPLFLTPIIESGDMDQAKKLSEVIHPKMNGTKSYSGFLTVNKKYNSNLFFWFFPSINNFETAPVVLWLQGGPGATSLFGLFMENGPFIVKNKNKVKKRKFTWSNYHNVLYIDNPVGAGYSFTESESGYAKNQIDVGKNLYEALQQFFMMFKELQNNEFYATGESYAGKYVPSIGYTIHKNNPTAKVKINLKGLAMGNGFSDPINQCDYGDYLYQIGLVDYNSRKFLNTYIEKGKNYIKNKNWLKVAEVFDKLIDGDRNGPSLFKNITNFDNYYNYLIQKLSNNSDIYLGKFIQSANVRKAIHVGNLTFHGDPKNVELHLIEDLFQSVAPWVSTLLNHYRVLIYNGQLDIIVAYPLTINYLRNLKFDASNDYLKANRHFWLVGDELAGYVKVAGNLTEILVRNAGHMVPHDQPKWAMDLITRFTHNKSYF